MNLGRIVKVWDVEEAPREEPLFAPELVTEDGAPTVAVLPTTDVEVPTPIPSSSDGASSLS